MECPNAMSLCPPFKMMFLNVVNRLIHTRGGVLDQLANAMTPNKKKPTPLKFRNELQFDVSHRRRCLLGHVCLHEGDDTSSKSLFGKHLAKLQKFFNENYDDEHFGFQTADFQVTKDLCT